MSSPSYTRFGVLRPKLLLRAALGCAVRTSAVALLPRRNGKAKTVGGFLFALYPSLALEAFAREVTLEESESILKKITAVQKRVLAAADRAHDPERQRALRAFGANLAKSFYSFEPDFFQQNVSRIVDDVISQIRASLELWPTLVEICYFRKDKEPLPATRVRNQGRNGGK